MSDIKGILNKLADMKRLSERPGTPGEAAAAVAAMQRLMEKHNVTQAELEAAGTIEKGTPIHEKYDIGATLEWRRALLSALAGANNCAALYDRKSIIHLFGKEEGIAVTTAMFEYLVLSINRLADSGWEESHEAMVYPGAQRSWKHAFRVGAALTIAKRIREQAQKSRGEAGRSGEIMVADLTDAERLMNKLFRTQSTRRSMKTSSSRGQYAGREAGNGVNLDSQIKSGKRGYKELGS